MRALVILFFGEVAAPVKLILWSPNRDGKLTFPDPTHVREEGEVNSENLCVDC